MMPEVDVVGAGGVGCALGYALLSAGVDVRYIDADEEKVETGQREGVRVGHRPPLPAAFESFRHGWTEPAGTVLLCVKSYDNPAVFSRLPDRVELIPIQKKYCCRLISPSPIITEDSLHSGRMMIIYTSLWVTGVAPMIGVPGIIPTLEMARTY